MHFCLPIPLSVAAYFGDLKDGVHKGDENDPRVSLIEVVPEEIRYWMPTKGTIGRALETGVGAMTGRVAAPGELRTITEAEVSVSFKFKRIARLNLVVDQNDARFAYEVNDTANNDSTRPCTFIIILTVIVL